MSLSERLAQLRPLMTRDEITDLLGPAEAKRALDRFGGLERETGVSVTFSFRDECIDSVTYSAKFNFSADVPVFGLRVGMDLPGMLAARPGTRLAEGETGEPNERGFVVYKAAAPSPETDLTIAFRDDKIYTIHLTRPDMSTVIARRKQEDDERRAGMERAYRLSEQWKSVKDPDEMVLSWARHCAVGQGANPNRFNDFARWLITTRDPEVWHMVAMNWN